uniref:Nucleobindin 2 n=1 Tax=Poecilia latipinna TaxID=48699 RepID=A0A3B3UNA8_9TELE
MVRRRALAHCGLVLLSWWLCIHSVPISVEKAKDKPEVEQLEPPESADTGLHYDRYLREVIEYLEKDPHFREKLKNANMDDIKVHQSVYLHCALEFKLCRVDSLLAARQALQRAGLWNTMDHQALLKQFEHLNHMNPHTFEVEDLDRLIQSATKDLENYDKERHDEFKRYEMMKEHERRERLKTMSEEDRKKEEQHYEEMKKKHANHPKVNHPRWKQGGGGCPVRPSDPKTT